MQHDLLELHLWFVVPLDFLAREILVPKQKYKPSNLGLSARVNWKQHQRRKSLIAEAKNNTWRHIAASRVFRIQVRYNRSVFACEKRPSLAFCDVDVAHAKMKRRHPVLTHPDSGAPCTQ